MADARSAVAAFLTGLGAPEGDPELAGTPERVVQLWRENLLSGQGVDPARVLAPLIPDAAGAIVTLTHLPFHGMCPHHLLPFHGVAHLAYEPAGFIVGLGALEKLLTALSRRLVLQETLTRDLAAALMEHLQARGAAVALEAEHLCLILQGREPRSARLHTRLALGSLEARPEVLPPVRH